MSVPATTGMRRGWPVFGSHRPAIAVNVDGPYFYMTQSLEGNGQKERRADRTEQENVQVAKLSVGAPMKEPINFAAVVQAWQWKSYSIGS